MGKNSISITRISTAKLTLITFKLYEAKTVHLQMDNITALTYLLKWRGTKSSELKRIAQKIWEFLISKSIIITAKYIPRLLNILANWESHHVQD